jgi:SnoaL-like domain
VAAAPINTVLDLLADPHVAARDMLRTIPDVRGRGVLHVPGSPIPAVAASFDVPPPDVGEHTDEILRELTLLPSADSDTEAADAQRRAASAAAPVPPTGTGDTFPPKFWGSREGKIDVRPLGQSPLPPDQVADRLLIWETFSRFGVGHDENRLDVVLSTMTDDVVMETANGSATPQISLHGKNAVRARLGPNLPLMYGQRRHCITNVLIDDFTGTTASAIAYGIVPRAADGFVLQASVLYSARLRKEADGFWRFTYFYIGCDDYAGEGPGQPKFLDHD